MGTIFLGILRKLEGQPDFKNSMTGLAVNLNGALVLIDNFADNIET